MRAAIVAAAALIMAASAGPPGEGGKGAAKTRPSGAPTAAEVLKLAPKAPPLPKPTGKVVRVADVAALRKAVAQAEEGTTILLADGRYRVQDLWVRQSRLTIRGESGDREKVVLDGGGEFTRVVRVRGASDLLIADLTVANSKQYGIIFYGDSNVQRLKVYNVKVHNCWTRGLKGTHAARINDGRRRQPLETVRKIRPAGGQVRYCLFVNDSVKPYDDLFGGNYVGGIDIMWAKDWVIADSVFLGIRGRHGGGRVAIFVCVNSENVVSERNLIVNCDNGICYGNPSGERLHMTGGVIRNNFIAVGRRAGLEICRTRDTRAYHNTLVSSSVKHLTVRFFQGAGGGRFFNNLVRGRVSLPKDVATGGNLTGKLDGWFVDPRIGDLHLAAKGARAVGAGAALKEVTEDFDRQKRKAVPDVGADETAPATPAGGVAAEAAPL